jgi:hypothetical protein
MIKKIIIQINGSDKIEFCNDQNQYHREDGPAIIYGNYYKLWYINGKLHREDGPAIEYSDGRKYWYRNGKYHREDGPAIEWSNGDKQYWYEGEFLEECHSDEFLKKWIRLRAFR